MQAGFARGIRQRLHLAVVTGTATVEHDLWEQVQGAAKPSCVPMSRWRQRERLRADRRPMGYLSEVHREPTNHASIAHWLRRAYVTMPGGKAPFFTGA